MLKVSKIISKQVVSIYECEYIGTVKNVIFNNTFKKVLGFVFFNDEMENESFVSIENVYAFSNDSVLVRNLSKIDYISPEETTPMNKGAYALNGDFKGKINDVLVNEKGMVEKFLTNKEHEIFPSQLLKVGFDTCMVNLDEDKKVTLSSFKPKMEFDKKEEMLETIKVKLVKLDQPEIEEKVKASASLPTMPVKAKPDLNKLLGKKAIKTILGINNEVIVRQNSLVSKHTLDMAKMHNKTYELIFSTI